MPTLKTLHSIPLVVTIDADVICWQPATAPRRAWAYCPYCGDLDQYPWSYDDDHPGTVAHTGHGILTGCGAVYHISGQPQDGGGSLTDRVRWLDRQADWYANGGPVVFDRNHPWRPAFLVDLRETADTLRAHAARLRATQPTEAMRPC